MASKVLKFTIGPFSTTQPPGVRDSVLDFPGGPLGRDAFRYKPGLEVRDKLLTLTGDLDRKYRISEQRV